MWGITLNISRGMWITLQDIEPSSTLLLSLWHGDFPLHHFAQPSSCCCYLPRCTLITKLLSWQSVFSPHLLILFAPSPSLLLYSSAGQEWPGRAMCFQSGLDSKSKRGFCVYQAAAPSPCSYSHLEALANWWQQQQPCSTQAPFFMCTHTHTHTLTPARELYRA